MRKVDVIFNSMLKNAAPTGYVSDGLVFQIDGILDQSTIPQPIVAQWDGPTKSFTEYRGTVVRNSANNGWYFDGATCLQATGNLIPVSYQTSTIEIVFKDYNGFTKNNFLFGNGRSDGNNIIAATNTAPKFVYTPEANPAYEMQPTTDIVTVSASSAIGMLNRESLTASGSYLFGRWGVVSIGGRPDSTTYDLYGEIYAIRVYNRQLTKSEVMHNQILDYARFNSAPYTYYDYLESDGNGQYIDTGVVPNNNYNMEVDDVVVLTAANPDAGLVSCEQGWQIRMFGLLLYNNRVLISGCGNGTIDYTLTYGERYNFTLIGGVANYYHNGNLVFTRTHPASTFTCPVSLTIFASNTNGVIYPSKFVRIGAVRIYDGGTLIRDFRPAVRNADGVSGMHDVVNDVFYTNANPAGDNFLYGNLT